MLNETLHHFVPKWFYNRVILVAFSLTFVYLFDVNFNTLIVEKFEYFGFRRTKLDLIDILFVKVIVVFNCFFLPSKINRASEFLNLFLFLFIYLPSSVVLFSVRADWMSKTDALNMFFVLSICIFIISLFSKLPLARLKLIVVPRTFFILINVVFFLLFIVIFIESLSNFKVFGLSQLSSLNETRQTHSISGIYIYFYLWIITFFLGLFLGEFKRVNQKVRLLGLSIIYFVFAFSMGAKILLVAPFVFCFVVIWAKFFSRRTFVFFAAFVSFFLLINLVSILSPDVGFAISALFTFRTLSISSLSFVIYFDYFSTHNFTDFSHVGFVNSISNLFSLFTIEHSPLPVVLGKEYGLGNFNASFFVNDGYASFGYAGMFIVTIIYSLILYLIDCVTRTVDRAVVLLSLTYYGMYLGNISLFTLLISHGLIFVIFYYYLFSRYLTSEI